jgi:hypothetical protein
MGPSNNFSLNNNILPLIPIDKSFILKDFDQFISSKKVFKNYKIKKEK